MPQAAGYMQIRFPHWLTQTSFIVNVAIRGADYLSMGSEILGLSMPRIDRDEKFIFRLRRAAVVFFYDAATDNYREIHYQE